MGAGMTDEQFLHELKAYREKMIGFGKGVNAAFLQLVDQFTEYQEKVCTLIAELERRIDNPPPHE